MASHRYTTLGDYLAKKGLKCGLASLGLGVGVTGIFTSLLVATGLLWVGAGLIANVGHLWSAPGTGLLITIAGLAGGLILVCWALLRTGRAILDAAEEVPEVTLITHDNTASVPPRESLVRGAEAPVDPAAESLLRAAQPGRESDADGLLQAAEAAAGGQRRRGATTEDTAAAVVQANGRSTMG
jgi:hypothetical protein